MAHGEELVGSMYCPSCAALLRGNATGSMHTGSLLACCRHLPQGEYTGATNFQVTAGAST